MSNKNWLQNRIKSVPPTLRAALASVKKELRKWYGTISVDELAENRELTLEIETLERMLALEGV